jgi:hypothetical protein
VELKIIVGLPLRIVINFSSFSGSKLKYNNVLYALDSSSVVLEIAAFSNE